MTTRIELPPAPRILVVALRRLGDVLLTTPLIRSLRKAWPDATIDVLVFADTAGILAGNPDLDGVITLPARPSVRESLRLAAQLWNRYALAISTQSGDRPTVFAWIGGRHCIGPVDAGLRGNLRQWILDQSVPLGVGGHRVEEVLRLADALGIARVPEVACPVDANPWDAGGQPFAVVHAAPKFRYKQWTRQGWRDLATALAQRGLRVLATGGPSAAERDYLDEVWKNAPVERFDGRLSWIELASTLAQAAIYVGPDTSVTHLAAASGCPTIALFGPTDPRLWGPWPAGGLTEPWAASGTIQRRGNVWLVQNPLPCLPCQKEGCERHIESGSACLDRLSPQQVLLAVEQVLASSTGVSIKPHGRGEAGGGPAQRSLKMSDAGAR